MATEPTTLYFRANVPANPSNEGNLKAPQRIGAVWAEINELREQGLIASRNIRPQVTSLLGRLCVTPTDWEAQQALLPVLKKIFRKNVTITPLNEEFLSGVYLCKEKGVPFAVFKAGEKRARTELLARHIAHLLGWEKHITSGLFCSLANPRFSADPIEVELWNGRQKEFAEEGVENYTAYTQFANDHLPNPSTLTGILEPFAPPMQMDLEGFVNMTALAICLGLRDAKLDGIRGNAILIDVEEIMPDPDLAKDVNQIRAELNLPYLEHPLSGQPIPRSQLEALKNKLDALDLPRFLNDLKEQKILFSDTNAQDIEMEGWGYDHGGCPVHIFKTPEADRNRGFAEGEPILSRSQLMACGARIDRLRNSLGERLKQNQPTTCLDLVRSADPVYKAHFNALLPSTTVPYACSVVGRLTPSLTRSPLTPMAMEEILSARSSTNEGSQSSEERRARSADT